MNRYCFVLAAVTTLAAALTVLPASAANDVPAAATRPAKEIAWSELVPKDWDPFKRFKQTPGLDAAGDGSPEGLRMMREMREAWDNAPTVAALDGVAIKLPGYVVPLDETKDGLKEFLLVPYFGACIHSPPPPANQIVHVRSDKPVKGFRAMDTVWVSGTMSTRRGDSPMGASGYQLQASTVDRYVPPARR